MGKIKRKFDVKFKEQVCQAIENGTTTVLEVCQEYQLQRVLVEGWLAKYVSGELEDNTLSRLRQIEKENERLRAKVGELTMTVDILKKAEAWKKQQKNGNSWTITSQSFARSQQPVDPSDSRPPATTTSRKRK
jgi:transposase-like protein